jgi:hypothetical protein
MESHSFTIGNTSPQRVDEAQAFVGVRHRF